MELKDTIKLMQSKDYADRFLAEYHQLSIRTKKLGKMLEEYRNGVLLFEPKCDYEILYEQHMFMLKYKEVLIKRAEMENIKLD